ncbi:MAG: radical SAM protein [Candidatus Wallbacteria bacterium]
MKILLVNPATAKDRVDVRGRFKGSDIFRYPKLGVLAIAGVTPERHSVEIIDETVEIIDYNRKYDIVGISAVTALANRAYEIAAEFKKRNVFTVMGGCHATFLPEEAILHTDCVIRGLGEKLWPEFLNDFENNPGGVKKIYETRCGAYDRNLLSGAGFPARFAENKKGYAAGHVFSIMRGCVKKCDFCSVNAFFERKVYKRPIEEAYRELQTLPQWIINLVDDNIYSDPEYAMEFFKRVRELKKHWLFQASTDIVKDRKLLKVLSEAGAKGVFIGLESISAQNLIDVNKTQNRVDEFKRIIDVFHEFGIVVEAGMMFGFDCDTPAVFESTYKFFHDANLDLMQIATVTPMPGTAFYDDMKSKGRIISDNWDDFDCKKVVIKPALMTGEELKNGTDWLRNEFYSYKSILKRGLSNFIHLGVIGTLGYFLRGNLGFKKNHALGLDYPP